MSINVNVSYMIPNLSERIRDAMSKQPKAKAGQVLCNVGDELNKHFQFCGQTVARLEADGWTVEAYSDSCRASHHDVATSEQAEIRLKAIGVDPSSVSIAYSWNDWLSEPDTSTVAV